MKGNDLLSEEGYSKTCQPGGANDNRNPLPAHSELDVDEDGTYSTLLSEEVCKVVSFNFSYYAINTIKV